MSRSASVAPDAFNSFGELLRYLRRRARLTQRELSIAVGYSEPQISYLETNSRLPDAATVAARFVTALDLADEPLLARRLVELAEAARPRESSTNADLTSRPNVLALAAPQHNLPAQPTALVGRERELAQIADLLANPACRLLTLTGVGGIGKTRLALAAAEQRQNDYADGVRFVPLAGVSSADLLATAIMDVLDAARYGDAPPEEQLMRYVRDKALLLVLDNFEHLMEGASLVARLLETEAGMKLLVTSRERLRLKAEWVYPVEGLALPLEGWDEERQGFAQNAEDGARASSPADLPLPDALARYDAMKLFVQSAQRSDAAFRLTVDNASAVRRICRHVEGMPLGIELAAGWTRQLSCDAIAARLESGLEALHTDARDAPARQQSLQAVFEYSWRLLAPAERASLAQLGVFRGGLDLDAAQAVAVIGLETLSVLLDTSWLRVVEGRYEIHELVRQFALDKLDAGDEGLPADPGGQAAARRHSAHYSDLLRELSPDLLTGRQIQAAATILREIGNVQAGWRWAVQHDEAGLIDGYLDALGWMVFFRGWYHEMQRAFTDAVLRLRTALADPATGAEETQRGIRRTLLRVLYHRANSDFGFYLPPGWTETNWTEYFDFWRGEGAGLYTPGEEARARLTLAAWMCDRAKNPDRGEVLRLGEEGLAYYASHDDVGGASYAWALIGMVQIKLGRYLEARHALIEAIASMESTGNDFDAATMRVELADCMRVSGDLADARQLYDAAVTLGREMASPAALYQWISSSGRCSLACGEYDRARREFTECLALAGQLGQSHLEMWPRDGLAEVAYAEGDYAGAKRMLVEVLAAARALGSHQDHDDVRITMGKVERALGQHTESASLLAEALTVSEWTQHVNHRTKALAAIAELLNATGRSAPAATIAAWLDSAPEADYVAKVSARALLSALAPGIDPADLAAGGAMTLDACVALARTELSALSS